MYSVFGIVDGGRAPSNDDRILLNELLMDEGKNGFSTGVLPLTVAVCDGVGGTKRGDLAAEAALKELRSNTQALNTAAGVADAVKKMNDAVLCEQVRVGCTDGMYTTLAAICCYAGGFSVFNVGDSRVYRFRFKYLMRLSRDHSEVWEMVDNGDITEEEAFVHPRKNVITRWLGGERAPEPFCEIYDEEPIVGDIYLICSDGMTDEVPEDMIRELLFEHKNDASLSACATALHDKALECGAGDNISVVLIRKESDTDG